MDVGMLEDGDKATPGTTVSFQSSAATRLTWAFPSALPSITFAVGCPGQWGKGSGRYLGSSLP